MKPVWVAAILLSLISYDAPECLAGNKFSIGTTNKASASTIDGAVEATGRIWPKQRFSLRMKPGLMIQEVFVGSGEQVRKGDLLLRLVDDSLLTQYSQLDSQVRVFQQERDRASLLLVKVETLKKRLAKISSDKEGIKRQGNGLSKTLLSESLRRLKVEEDEVASELLLAETEFKLKTQRIKEQAQVADRLKKRLHGLQQQLNQLEVRAPFPGKVVQLAVLSESHLPGAPLLTLWGDSGFEVKGKVSQHQLGKIQHGAQVQIYPGFYDETYVNGQVKAILPLVDEAVVKGFPSFTVLIDVPPSKRIIPGAAVSLRILPGQKAGN